MECVWTVLIAERVPMGTLLCGLRSGSSTTFSERSFRIFVLS